MYLEMSTGGFVKDLYEYLSYREFLSDFYNTQKEKKAWFSYRYISQKTGIDASLFAKIVQKQRHLTERYYGSVMELCQFDDTQKEFFQYLILFEKARTQDEVRVAFEKLMAFNENYATNIEAHQYEFYQKWYYSAIRILLDFYDCDKTYKDLGQKLRPSISGKEAKQAVQLLSELGMVEKDHQGKWRPTAANLSSGERWKDAAVQTFQKESLHLSLDALENIEAELRDISTVSISIQQNKLPEFKAMIAEFRRQLLQYVRTQQNEDVVYQLNVQFFPISR